MIDTFFPSSFLVPIATLASILVSSGVAILLFRFEERRHCALHEEKRRPQRKKPAKKRKRGLAAPISGPTATRDGFAASAGSGSTADFACGLRTQHGFPDTPRFYVTKNLDPEPSCPLIRVLTFNVLAPRWASASGRHRLKNEERGSLIYKSIFEGPPASPDFIGLQEVEKGAWGGVGKTLAASGFRSAEAKFTDEPRVSVLLGWNATTFAPMGKPAQISFKSSAFDDLKRRFGTRFLDSFKWKSLRKDGAACVGLFERLHAEHPEFVIAASLHLHWDPSVPQVKLYQTLRVLDEMAALAASVPSTRPKFVIFGDFNSLPDSLVYRLLTQGLSGTTAAKANMATEIFQQLLTHPLAGSFASIALSFEEEEPTTNINPSGVFSGCLDYIFTSRDIEPAGWLQVPNDTTEFMESFPSDHVSLYAALYNSPSETTHFE